MRTGSRLQALENVRDQMPPFWGLLEDNLLPLAVVLLARGAAAGFVSKSLSVGDDGVCGVDIGRDRSAVEKVKE